MIGECSLKWGGTSLIFGWVTYDNSVDVEFPLFIVNKGFQIWQTL